MTISTATAFLESAYSKLNEFYFENTLPRCAITIQSTPKAYGHFTTREIWQDGKRATLHEINLGAENLNRPTAETIATLIHEMVHFYCHENGIKDTSRGGTYHNSRFKEEAEKRGITVTYDEKIVGPPPSRHRSFGACALSSTGTGSCVFPVWASSVPGVSRSPRSPAAPGNMFVPAAETASAPPRM